MVAPIYTIRSPLLPSPLHLISFPNSLNLPLITEKKVTSYYISQQNYFVFILNHFLGTESNIATNNGFVLYLYFLFFSSVLQCPTGRLLHWWNPGCLWWFCSNKRNPLCYEWKIILLEWVQCILDDVHGFWPLYKDQGHFCIPTSLQIWYEHRQNLGFQRWGHRQTPSVFSWLL